MPDSTKERGKQDRERINVNQDYELRDWAQSLGVSQDRIKEAVQAVGDRADKVREFLKGDQRSGGSSERGSTGAGKANR